MLQAELLLRDKRFDRETIEMLCAALENSCSALGAPQGRGPALYAELRVVMAEAIFTLACAGQRNPQTLKSYALFHARYALIEPRQLSS